ncbi:MAG TPA: MBL fold metallo-hydrolase [bacterium]|nr:MBL fold metallo-hydrolase [bacterium]
MFLQARWPSANSYLVTSDPPVLIDTGYCTEVPRLEAALAACGVALQDIGLIVNTHSHSDHIGGNSAVQARSGAPIAMHPYEGRPINQGDWWSAGLRYLNQEASPFRVARYLEEGQELRFGGVCLEVIHVPGHSSGSIAFYERSRETLIVGDVFHADDVGWINAPIEGAIAVHNARQSIERLARLPIQRAYSGHGPAIGDAAASAQAALRRIESFIAEPRRMALHGMKRVFVFALMIGGGIAEREVVQHLRQTLWFPEFCVRYFDGESQEAVAGRLLDELLSAGAIALRDGRLMSTAMGSTQPV